jgi:hypothetical protein
MATNWTALLQKEHSMRLIWFTAAASLALATPSHGAEKVIGTIKTPKWGIVHSVPISGDKVNECFRLYLDKTKDVYNTLMFCPCEDQTERQDKDTIPVLCPVEGSEGKERIK